jgi:hypothetical protein
MESAEEFHAEGLQQDSLMVTGLSHAAGAEFVTVGEWKQNINSKEFALFVQDTSRLVAHPRCGPEISIAFSGQHQTTEL